MSFRHFIEKADAAGYLLTIDRPVDTTFEVANVAHALEGRPVRVELKALGPDYRPARGAARRSVELSPPGERR